LELVASKLEADAAKPLTKGEFARLLRAFAHLIEVSEEPSNDTPRRPRKAHERADPSADVVARVDAALKRRGVMP
jgi:hypothetical protein